MVKGRTRKRERKCINKKKMLKKELIPANPEVLKKFKKSPDKKRTHPIKSMKIIDYNIKEEFLATEGSILSFSKYLNPYNTMKMLIKFRKGSKQLILQNILQWRQFFKADMEELRYTISELMVRKFDEKIHLDDLLEILLHKVTISFQPCSKDLNNLEKLYKSVNDAINNYSINSSNWDLLINQYAKLKLMNWRSEVALNFFEDERNIEIFYSITGNEISKKYIKYRYRDEAEENILAIYIESATYERPTLLDRGGLRKSLVYFENKFEFDNKTWNNLSWCRAPLHSIFCSVSKYDFILDRAKDNVTNYQEIRLKKLDTLSVSMDGITKISKSMSKIFERVDYLLDIIGTDFPNKTIKLSVKNHAWLYKLNKVKPELFDAKIVWNSFLTGIKKRDLNQAFAKSWYVISKQNKNRWVSITEVKDVKISFVNIEVLENTRNTFVISKWRYKGVFSSINYVKPKSIQKVLALKNLENEDIQNKLNLLLKSERINTGNESIIIIVSSDDMTKFDIMKRYKDKYDFTENSSNSSDFDIDDLYLSHDTGVSLSESSPIQFDHFVVRK